MADIERDKLIGRLLAWKHYHLQFLDTLRDSAMLAGEQVQDKRLDFLEQPPGVTASTALMDILISLTFSAAANLVIKKVCMAVMPRILGDRFSAKKSKIIRPPAPKIYGPPSPTNDSKLDDVARILARSDDRFRPTTNRELAEASKFVQVVADRIREELPNPKSDVHDLWITVAEDVLKVAPDMVKSRLLGREKETKAQERNQVNVGADTASVAVRRSALSFARLQKQTVERLYDFFLDQVLSNSPLVSPTAFINYLTPPKVDSPQTQEEWDAVEKQLSLYFEAIIWTLYVGSADNLEGYTTYVEDSYANLEGISGRRVRAPSTWYARKPELLEYFVNRFPDPNDPTGQSSFLQYNKGRIRDAEIAFVRWYKILEEDVRKIPKNVRLIGLKTQGPVKFRK